MSYYHYYIIIIIIKNNDIWYRDNNKKNRQTIVVLGSEVSSMIERHTECSVSNLKPMKSCEDDNILEFKWDPPNSINSQELTWYIKTFNFDDQLKFDT